MRAAICGRVLRIRNPHSIRPWQHVLEALDGYLTLAEHLCEHRGNYAEGWNFGPDDSEARSVIWVVERLAELWGHDFRWEADNDGHPHEATYLKLDCSKARWGLNWSPRLPLLTALDWTVDWYKAYRQGKDMRTLTAEQLEEYNDLPRSHMRVSSVPPS
jgi:CDP-glucose 4,6-dehydratase